MDGHFQDVFIEQDYFHSSETSRILELIDFFRDGYLRG